MPDDFQLPAIPDLVDTKHSGRIAVVTSRNYSAAVDAGLVAAGASVIGIERLTLEEIFILAVQDTEEGRWP